MPRLHLRFVDRHYQDAIGNRASETHAGRTHLDDAGFTAATHAKLRRTREPDGAQKSTRAVFDVCLMDVGNVANREVRK
jgi:hypothetical protein